MTVTQLLANTTSRELAEWRAIYRIEKREQEKARADKMKANVRTGFQQLMDKQKQGVSSGRR